MGGATGWGPETTRGGDLCRPTKPQPQPRNKKRKAGLTSENPPKDWSPGISPFDCREDRRAKATSSDDRPGAPASRRLSLLAESRLCRDEESAEEGIVGQVRPSVSCQCFGIARVVSQSPLSLKSTPENLGGEPEEAASPEPNCGERCRTVGQSANKKHAEGCPLDTGARGLGSSTHFTFSPMQVRAIDTGCPANSRRSSKQNENGTKQQLASVPESLPWGRFIVCLCLLVDKRCDHQAQEWVNKHPSQHP